MRILIHAVPARMWYVRDFLVPQLRAQGAAADEVEIFLDDRKLGNLRACMEAFAAREGDGGTWHIQDDVLPCRDFVRRCREMDDRDVVMGFCSEAFGDDPDLTGTVYVPDLWHSFQCVRIPDSWARECAAWVRSRAWEISPNPDLPVLWDAGKGDDSFFREYMMIVRGTGTAYNAAPCLVDHVDFLLGGSVLSQWRETWVRAALWYDDELVDELRERIRAYKNSQ